MSIKELIGFWIDMYHAVVLDVLAWVVEVCAV